MKKKITYTEKFKTFLGKTLYENLSPDERQYIKHISYALQFTFQEFRQVVEASRDLSMWGEEELKIWWQNQKKNVNNQSPRSKKKLLRQLQTKYI